MPEKVDFVCPGAPEPVGPYSQVIKYGEMLFISGQVPLDPQTGEIAAPDIEGQTRRVLQSLQAITEASGGGLASIMKTTVFLTSMLDYSMVNEIYAEFFPFRPPARSVVEVQALPRGALIEIEAFAMLPSNEAM